jgi:hypothetical protein
MRIDRRIIPQHDEGVPQLAIAAGGDIAFIAAIT